jgi:circadian clock protein KaiB
MSANLQRAGTMSSAEHYNLRLYVAGQTPKSIAALTNLRSLCQQYLPGRHNIEVVDLMTNPQLAQRDQIVAVPTLVRSLPEPIKRIIGDLSNADKVLVGLDVEVGRRGAA